MNSTFSKNLKLLRENLGLKQDILAKKLDISRSILSYYENGKSEPTLSVLEKISSFFNINIDKLINENLILNDTFVDNKINDIVHSEPIKISNIYSDYTSILIELENKKKYYLKLVNTDLPKKINEINDLINYLNSYAQEIAEELAPNIINFPNNEINYRIINIAGNVSAGNPCYAYEDITDTLKISSNLLCDSKDYFALRIKGDSMNLLFDDGELILVEQSTLVSNDDIVIALIYDDATVKKFKFDSDSVYLIPQSSNPIHQIQTYNKNQVYILGKVVGKISDFQKKDE